MGSKSFAVIIDEAHSSQGGESTHNLHKALHYNSLEEAAAAEEEDEELTLDDEAALEMKSRGKIDNVSFFAFTATPKKQTLEIFGEKQPDGSYKPFSLYPMKQAIEEGFILDVLQNYTTYKTYFQFIKNVEDDPKFEKAKAIQLLHRYVDLHGDTIDKKVTMMLDHFFSNTQYKIGGKAKAMIVTKSRLHAVRYKLEFDKQLTKRNSNIKSLVAFTGSVPDNGLDFTESTMNGVAESKTKEEFEKDDYRFLIVANKFQTGFDQPLLQSMYVDKKLNSISAVQTLSRLNRIAPGKENVFVLDFVNDAETIQAAFQPFYQTTLLSQGTDPNILYTLQHTIEQFPLIEENEVASFYASYLNSNNQSDLHRLLTPSVQRFSQLSDEDKISVRDALRHYIKLYTFVTQFITFTDPQLEKLYQFCRFLTKKLPFDHTSLPKEILESVDLYKHDIRETFSGKLTVRDENGELTYNTSTLKSASLDEKEPLSQILESLNQISGSIFSEQEGEKALNIGESIAQDEEFIRYKNAANSRDNLWLKFQQLFEKKLVDEYQRDLEFYKKVQDTPDIKKTLKEKLFHNAMRR